MRGAIIMGLAALTLCGCANPTGPVFGDWYGFQILPVPGGRKSIELVLDGPADATSGVYRLHTQQYWPNTLLFNNSTYGSGRWTSEPVPGRAPWREIDMIDGPWGGRSYVMLVNRMLVPALRDAQGRVTGPDLGPAGFGGRLAARDPKSFGYGRA